MKKIAISLGLLILVTGLALAISLDPYHSPNQDQGASQVGRIRKDQPDHFHREVQPGP